MMQPKKTKFRRAHKGRIKGNTKGGSALNFGQFGLKALEPNRVNAREIEACRRAITREMKRQGRVWIRIFPDVPVFLLTPSWVVFPTTNACGGSGNAE
jgi:large subunit ribosomal protein L16